MKTPRMPRQLPIVSMDGREYFVDARLRQFRSISGPEVSLEFVEFESAKGSKFLKELNFLRCPECATACVARKQAEGVRCNGCDSWLPF